MISGALSRLVDALNAHSVRYIIVGGAALELHGSSYRTEDVDLVYSRDQQNINRLVEALRPLHPKLRVKAEPSGIAMQWDAKAILNGNNFTLITDIGSIDIFGVVAGGDTYSSLAPFAETIRAGKREIPILTLEGLLRTKRAASRRKDEMAIPEIEALIELENIRRESTAPEE